MYIKKKYDVALYILVSQYVTQYFHHTKYNYL